MCCYHRNRGTATRPTLFYSQNMRFGNQVVIASYIGCGARRQQAHKTLTNCVALRRRGAARGFLACQRVGIDRSSLVRAASPALLAAARGSGLSRRAARGTLHSRSRTIVRSPSADNRRVCDAKVGIVRRGGAFGPLNYRGGRSSFLHGRVIYSMLLRGSLGRSLSRLRRKRRKCLFPGCAQSRSALAPRRSCARRKPGNPSWEQRFPSFSHSRSAN